MPATMTIIVRSVTTVKAMIFPFVSEAFVVKGVVELKIKKTGCTSF